MSDINRVWNNTTIPVIVRGVERSRGILMRLPYSDRNRVWLKNGRRNNPEWNSSQKHWKLPKSWFDDTVDRALETFGKIYVIQPYREQEKCSPACMNAKGHECQCSCMGKHHGAGNDGSWFEVSDTFATRWRNQELACRLLVSIKAVPR